MIPIFNEIVCQKIKIYMLNKQTVIIYNNVVSFTFTLHYSELIYSSSLQNLIFLTDIANITYFKLKIFHLPSYFKAVFVYYVLNTHKINLLLYIHISIMNEKLLN